MRVAVVGAGIMGASSALALTDRGHDVTIFEQFPLGHDRGSSHGRSRIVRRAYPDPFYTAIMQEGYPMWAALQARLPVPILFEPGLVYFGHRESGNVRSMVAGLASLGVRHEVLGADEMRKAFPELHLAPDEVGVFTPEAGWVNADRAVLGSLKLAQEGGARVEPRRIDELDARFDRVIVCAGGWVKRWFPVPATVVRQTFGYVELGRSQSGPVWIEDSHEGFYGFPSEPGSTQIKIGVHRHGHEIDPDDPDRTPDPEDIELIREFASRRFGLVAPDMVGAKACLYTATPDEDFRFGQRGDRTFWASACSGHGFKFGPWVGHYMAGLAEGTRSLTEFPRFCVPV